MAPTTRGGPNTHVNDTNPNNMTPESVQAMIDQALLRNSTNGDGSHSSHGDNRRNVQTARPCFYADFMKCQPLNFKGAEGVVGLARRIEKMESVFNISGCPEAYAMTWEVLKRKMRVIVCPQGEIKKLEIELWNIKVKGNDVPAYTERFQELTLICTKFVANETEKIDKNSSYVETTETQSDNKKRADDSSRNNHGHQQQPFKRQNVAKVYNMGTGERKPYGGSLPKCNKCHLHHNGPCTQRCHKCNKIGHFARDCRSTGNTNVANTQKGNGATPKGNGCFECGAPGHFKRDCPKLKNKNGGNGNAQGWVYAVGNAEKRGNTPGNLMQIVALVFLPARSGISNRPLFPGALPKARGPISIGTSEMKELSEQLQEISDKGFIRPSSSPWGAPVLFVNRREGSYQDRRFVVIQGSVLFEDRSEMDITSFLKSTEKQTIRRPLSNSVMAITRFQHEEHLKAIPGICLEEKLYAKFSKCEFWIRKFIEGIFEDCLSNAKTFDGNQVRLGRKEENAFPSDKAELCSAPNQLYLKGLELLSDYDLCVIFVSSRESKRSGPYAWDVKNGLSYLRFEPYYDKLVRIFPRILEARSKPETREYVNEDEDIISNMLLGTDIKHEQLRFIQKLTARARRHSNSRGIASDLRGSDFGKGCCYYDDRKRKPMEIEDGDRVLLQGLTMDKVSYGSRGPVKSLERRINDEAEPDTMVKGALVNKARVTMSSATSDVTYTSVYSDSEPGRAFWGADYEEKEVSEGDIPRVIVLGYDGLPLQPVAPPSPDYILGPQILPVPQDEDEREPMFIQAHDPDYVPEPIYPEYIPLEDDHELPAEEQPLPPVDSPTAESPGYVTESDPEEDPEEYEDDKTEDGPVDYPMDGGDNGDDGYDGDDDDDDSSGDDARDEDDKDEEEEEEHLAPADSTVEQSLLYHHPPLTLLLGLGLLSDPKLL
ncbi:putative reverse transcriptase domain-containing protein [Tanacetum coccineum]